MLEVRLIDKSHKGDINILNEPFEVFGRFVVSYTDGKWDYKVCPYPKKDVKEMTFPNENYDYDKMSDCSFIGSYDGEKCVGLAILQPAPFKYIYLYDLKVCKAYRGQGVGKMLIDEAKKVALSRGYCGVYTIGQDNNVGACAFYIKNGFNIGGLDSRVYDHTPQQGKSDIYFYLDI